LAFSNGPIEGISYSNRPDSHIKERLPYTNTMKRNSNLQRKCIYTYTLQSNLVIQTTIIQTKSTTCRKGGSKVHRKYLTQCNKKQLLAITGFLAKDSPCFAKPRGCYIFLQCLE